MSKLKFSQGVHPSSKIQTKKLFLLKSILLVLLDKYEGTKTQSLLESWYPLYFQTNWKGKSEEICVTRLQSYLNLGTASLFYQTEPDIRLQVYW